MVICYRVTAEKLGGGEPSMSCNNLAVVRDKNRIAEAKPRDRSCDPLDLRLAVAARVARVWLSAIVPRPAGQPISSSAKGAH
jgi:hypothetical protein